MTMECPHGPCICDHCKGGCPNCTIDELRAEVEDARGDFTTAQQRSRTWKARAEKAEAHSKELGEINFRQAAKIMAIKGQRAAFWIELAELLGLNIRDDNSSIQDGIESLKSDNDQLRAEVEKLEQDNCDSCLEYKDDGTPRTTYGWNENSVEGQVPCGCISESGPYQVIEAQNKVLREALKVFADLGDEFAQQALKDTS